MKTLEEKRVAYRIKWRKWRNLHLTRSREIGNDAAKRFRKRHPSYINWMNMMSRCYNKNDRKYHLWGGRGISVYTPWKVFSLYEKDFGSSKPGPRYTVDRINNSGNYIPSNVQWLTKSENAKKRFNNEYCGERYEEER